MPNRPRTFVGVLLAAMAGTGGLEGCSEQSAPPLDLDVPLPQGRARAGRISKESELIGGLTARGTVGDYKLYNHRIAVVIAQKGAAREFQPYGGVIIDADRIRAAGDPGRSAFGEIVSALQTNVLEPERIEVVRDGSEGGEARIRVAGVEGPLPLFDVVLGGVFPFEPHELSWTTDYVLEPDTDHLRIEHVFHNQGRASLELASILGFFFGTGARPFLEGWGFSPSKTSAVAEYYAALGPDVSYLYGRPGSEITAIFGESGMLVTTVGETLRIRGGGRTSLTELLVIGDANLSRSQAIWRRLSGAEESIEVSGTLADEAGTPVAGAHIHVLSDQTSSTERSYTTQAPTGEDGRFLLELPKGRYELIATTDAGIVGQAVTVDLGEGVPIRALELTVPEAGVLEYAIRDREQRPLPVQLSIQPLEGAPSPLPSSFGEPSYGHGLAKTELAHTGEGRIELVPGSYRVLISRGAEYEVLERTVTLGTESPQRIEGVLDRSVRTTGWLSSDVHLHAQLSPDSSDSYPLKARALAAANIELPISTEHEALGDFGPAIRELGLGAWMTGLVGTEISTTLYGHFNAFPLVRDRSKPGFGKIGWFHKSPRELFELVHALPDRPFLQANHPRSGTVGYLELLDFDREAMSAELEGFSTDFDGLELINAAEAGCSDDSMEQPAFLDWFAFLNRGQRKVGTAASDDHRAETGQLGFPITYVRSETDLPSDAKLSSVLQSFDEGRLVISCGPFVEAKIGAAEIGDLVPVSNGELAVWVRVAAPSWMDVDEILLLIDGKVRASTLLGPPDGVERFHGTVTATIPQNRDAWVAVWVRGDQDSGLAARNAKPYAVTNPIFIDGDGDGRWEMKP